MFVVGVDVVVTGMDDVVFKEDAVDVDVVRDSEMFFESIVFVK